jgi:uracil phosphoribosyltransferase
MDNTIETLERMKFHFNGMVEAYQKLPELSSKVRQVIVEDAITVIAASMEGITNELQDYQERNR